MEETMTTTPEAPKRDELDIEDLDRIAGGSIEIREVIVKAAVAAIHTPPPAPTPKSIAIPYPNLAI